MTRINIVRTNAWVALVVLGFLFAYPLACLAVNASLSEILANPDRYDGEIVTISGTITNLRETVSRRGNAYYTFDLSDDGKSAIRVFSFGKSPCRSGAATVEGTFAKVKRQGRYVFYNEVEAQNVACK